MKNQRFIIVLTAINVSVFIATVAWTTTGAAYAKSTPIVLRAQMIELVDDQDIVRASLKVEPDKEAVFRMKDQSGVVRVKLGASDKGSGMALFDNEADPRPGIHMLAREGNTTLTINEKDKQPKILEP